jgi:hypothetical protein
MTSTYVPVVTVMELCRRTAHRDLPPTTIVEIDPGGWIEFSIVKNDLPEESLRERDRMVAIARKAF